MKQWVNSLDNNFAHHFRFDSIRKCFVIRSKLTTILIVVIVDRYSNVKWEKRRMTELFFILTMLISASGKLNKSFHRIHVAQRDKSSSGHYSFSRTCLDRCITSQLSPLCLVNDRRRCCVSHFTVSRQFRFTLRKLFNKITVGNRTLELTSLDMSSSFHRWTEEWRKKKLDTHTLRKTN